jgi:X-X-X-Leu-X-X-Gly heptad repeat protein
MEIDKESAEIIVGIYRNIYQLKQVLNCYPNCKSSDLCRAGDQLGSLMNGCLNRTDLPAFNHQFEGFNTFVCELKSKIANENFPPASIIINQLAEQTTELQTKLGQLNNE